MGMRFDLTVLTRNSIAERSRAIHALKKESIREAERERKRELPMKTSEALFVLLI